MEDRDRAYIAFGAAHGVGPWVCTGCLLEVTRDSLAVHHSDHDDSNDSPSNLVPMHRSCHAGHHMKDRWRDDPEGMSTAVSEGRIRQLAGPGGDTYRQKMSLTRKRQWAEGIYSRDTLAKVRASLTPEQRTEYARKAGLARQAKRRAEEVVAEATGQERAGGC